MASLFVNNTPLRASLPLLSLRESIEAPTTSTDSAVTSTPSSASNTFQALGQRPRIITPKPIKKRNLKAENT
jgi:hypothetical protein